VTQESLCAIFCAQFALGGFAIPSPQNRALALLIASTKIDRMIESGSFEKAAEIGGALQTDA